MTVIANSRRAACLTLGCLALALAAPLRAQSAFGRLEGVATDSAHARWPEGASVLAIRADPPAHSAGATVDSRGRYRIDSLPAGRYMVEFASPFLDSLEIALPPREVTVEAGRATRADFAIPSGRTLRSGACPGVPLARGSGALIGRVLDADTEAPLVGARVAVVWHETAVDRASLRAETAERSGAVTTDSIGRYRICGVPTDDWVVVQVQHGGRAGTDVRVSVPDSAGVAVRQLSLSATASRSMAAPADSAPPPLTGSASVTGVVRGVGGLPLADAQVRVLGARGTVVSDARGRFTLGDLPSGTQVLEVRRIGYLLAQQSVELRGGRNVVQDVPLRRIVTLDSVRVLARRSLYREFEFNRKANRFGKFFTIDSIEKRRPLYASDLFRSVPGFRVTGFGLDAVVGNSRGVTSIGGSGSCAANVVIDGIEHQEINLINPYDIGAMEIYRPGEPAPPQYRSSCGVIVIWSRRG
ncbi:MAG TPA: carboxypeptidase regulatory-like domain-containing protein [Gemmatimonadaceae bacterium]|nr:carboxypeptidase regulatory-like domain-containing protein [Gemmatimonadaceae bacterium]